MPPEEIVYVPSSVDGLIFPVPKNIYEARKSGEEGYFSWIDEYRADYEALKEAQPVDRFNQQTRFKRVAILPC